MRRGLRVHNSLPQSVGLVQMEDNQLQSDYSLHFRDNLWTATGIVVTSSDGSPNQLMSNSQDPSRFVVV